jgi:hypothetical protein
MSVGADTNGRVAVRRAPHGGSPKRAEARFAVLLVLPALVAFAAVILYPFVNSLRLSLYRYTLMTPEPVWTGLGNFRRLMEDGILLQSWLTTVFYVVVTTAATGGGPVTLSWPDAQTPSPATGYCVVIHEFVHKMDMRQGPADGCPPLPTHALEYVRPSQPHTGA